MRPADIRWRTSASVRVWWTQRDSRYGTQTDASGRFRIGGLLPEVMELAERVELVAEHREYPRKRMWVRIDSRPHRDDLRIELERGVQLSGHVVATNGAGIGGARVRALQRSTETFSGGVALDFFCETKTRADGSFRLPAMPPAADVELYVSHSSYAATRQIGIDARRDVTRIRLQLDRGVKYELRATNTRGETLTPPWDFFIAAVDGEPTDWSPNWLDSGQDGRRRLWFNGETRRGYWVTAYGVGQDPETARPQDLRGSQRAQWAPGMENDPAEVAVSLRLEPAARPSLPRVDDLRALLRFTAPDFVWGSTWDFELRRAEDDKLLGNIPVHGERFRQSQRAFTTTDGTLRLRCPAGSQPVCLLSPGYEPRWLLLSGNGEDHHPAVLRLHRAASIMTAAEASPLSTEAPR